MNYSIKGKGKFKLTGSDFVTSGGEAKIFLRNKVIYKIYHNSSDMIPDGKIYELQEINERKVLIPKDIINDSNGVRVGFTMDYIDKVIPLCKLFTNTFLNENDVSNDTLIALMSHMEETIHKVHEAGCIQVDGNELNYLVDEKDFKKCYFIDVNSYQTKSFPATVIMPSIRDWTAKTFNDLTDWYSFAIITCQLLIGIHPFKGKHQDFKRHAIEERMRANISIFNKNTRVPKSVRNFDRIPTNYMDWFINLFEKGKRETPPRDGGDWNSTVTYIVVTSTNNFVIEERDAFDDVILSHYTLNGIPITRTKKSIYIGSDKIRVGRGVHLFHTPLSLTPVMVKLEDGNVVIKSCTKKEVKMGSDMVADDIMIVDDTIYIKLKGNFIETRIVDNNNFESPVMLVVKTTWQISEKSSQLFKNIIVQDIMGSKHILVPKPSINNSKILNIKITELDKYRILDARYEVNIAIFSVFDPIDKEYGLMVIKGIDEPSYNFRFIKTIDFEQANFTTLDNGIVILIYDDQMEIFSNKVGSTKVKMIKDKELNSDMSLCKRGTSTRFFTDNKLYSIGIK